ncbi:MAG: cytochrome c [Thermoleophilaceae bacterium]|nr:cytochrome c [Thermoleophilaceae bacterium]
MTRPSRPIVFCAAALGLLLGGCGEADRIEVAENDPMHRGAELFQERCSGCHTLSAAGSSGSKPLKQRTSNDRTNGPNLDQRVESAEDVLYAIRNGGFSGAIMPANIVVGPEAQAVADFVAEYGGSDREISPGDDAAPPPAE